MNATPFAILAGIFVSSAAAYAWTRRNLPKTRAKVDDADLREPFGAVCSTLLHDASSHGAHEGSASDSDGGGGDFDGGGGDFGGGGASDSWD